MPGEGGRRPGLAVVLLLLCIGSAVFFPNFIGAGNLSAIALSSALVLIAAAGALMLLISGHLDISVGSMFALVGVAVAIINTTTGSALLAVGGGLVLGAVLGAVNGAIVEFFGIPSLIVTLATLGIFRGLAYLISGGHSIDGLSAGLTGFAHGTVGGVPTLAVVALATFGLCTWGLSSSVTGLRLFAVGGDRRVARRLGVRTSRLVLGSFAFNGMLVGLAAVLGTAVLSSGSPTAGVGFEISVLTAVILGGAAITGGRGHPVGVLLGVATIGMLDAALIFAGFPESAQLIAGGAVLLTALIGDQLIVRRRRRTAVPIERSGDTGFTTVDAAPEPATGDCTVSIRGVSVHFPGTTALSDVTLDLVGGEVVCLVGDNGAGKSALVGVLAGVLTPSAGQVHLGGIPIAADPHRARAAGVETVFQRPALCPNLTGLDNLVLGREPRRRLCGLLPVRDEGAAENWALRCVSVTGLAPATLGRRSSALSGGEQQLLALTRVLRSDSRAVLLDEPTANLGVRQGSAVLRLARALARSGRAVLYVTHDVEEVFDIADRVVVLQRGTVIHDSPLRALTRLELLALMSGRNRQEAHRTLQAVDEERFKIERNLHDGAQQELLHAALMVGVAADSVGEGTDPEVVELLRSSKLTIRQALSTLRDLSRGIYPSVLATGGLPESLADLARRSPRPVDLYVNCPRLPEAVELVVHFAVAEALTNVAKHAEATAVRVQVHHRGEVLAIDITDDGRGGADESLGTGLAGMRARVRAIDGTLSMRSPAQMGTCIEIRIPALPVGHTDAAEMEV